jgi:hypothetical protein
MSKKQTLDIRLVAVGDKVAKTVIFGLIRLFLSGIPIVRIAYKKNAIRRKKGVFTPF